MENLKHSPVLFITDDGDPMQFYIPSRILEKYENLKHLIEHGSGIVVTTPCLDALHLIENKTKILHCKEGEQFVKIQFVLDCVAANTLYDIHDYILSVENENVSDISDQEEEEIINHAKEFCKSERNNKVKVLTERNMRTHVKTEKGARTFSSWTKEEDHKVIDFILTFPHKYGPEKKYVIYKLISENKIVNRSASAIGNHMYYILQGIRNYGLTDKEIQKLVSQVCILKKNTFTIEDDLKMINYIIKHKYYKRVTGKSIYKKMVKEKVIKGKHPMAMHKRFKTKILPNLDAYKLLPHHMDRFLNRNEYSSFSSEGDNVEYEASSADECKNIDIRKRKKRARQEKDSRTTTLKPTFPLSERKFFKVEQIDPDFLEYDDDFYETKKKKKHVNRKTRASKRHLKNKSDAESIDMYVSLPVKRKKLHNLRENHHESASSSIIENNNFICKIESDAISNDQPLNTLDSEVKSESLELHTCELLNNNQKEIDKWYDTNIHPFSLPDAIDDELCGKKTNCKNSKDDMYITESINIGEGLKVNNGNRKSPELRKELASSTVVSSESLDVDEENVHISASNENNMSLISNADQIVIPDTYDSQNIFNTSQDEKIEKLDKNEDAENSFTRNGNLEVCDSIFYEKAEAILEKMKPVISNMRSSDEDKDTLLKYVDELHLLLSKNKHKQDDFS